MSTSVRYYANGSKAEQWTNATQSGDPTPAGYTAWNTDGSIATQRALTTAETTALANADTASTQAANQATIQQNARNALTNNQTYLAIVSPTNAQVVAQVQALTRQMNGVIRLLLNQLDATT